MDDSWEGFQWVEANDANGNTLIYLRKDRKQHELLIAVNFSPIDRKGTAWACPVAGTYEVLLNSDDEAFGGQGRGNKEPLKPNPLPPTDSSSLCWWICLPSPASSSVAAARIQCGPKSCRKNPVKSYGKGGGQDRQEKTGQKRTKMTQFSLSCFCIQCSRGDFSV